MGSPHIPIETRNKIKDYFWNNPNLNTTQVGEIFGVNRTTVARIAWEAEGDYVPRKQPCKVDGCSAVSKSNGYCNFHYQRWYRHGNTDASKFAHTTSKQLQEIVNLHNEGLSNYAIAKRMGMSPRTIKRQLDKSVKNLAILENSSS